jgi:hypothetical protein
MEMDIGDIVELTFGDNNFNQLTPGREAFDGQEAVEPTYAQDGLYSVEAVSPDIIHVLGRASFCGWRTEELAQTYAARFGGHTGNGHLRLVPTEGPVTAFARIASRVAQDGTIDYILYVPVTAQETAKVACDEPTGG